MPAGNPQAYMDKGMPKRQAFALARKKLLQQHGNFNQGPGGRRGTPGGGPQGNPGNNRFHPARSANKPPLGNGKPPYIQRDPLNDYAGHNLPGRPGRGPGNTPPIIPGVEATPRPRVAPGEPDPNGDGTNGPPVIPGVHPTPRPGPTLGQRRLSMLSDKDAGNDKRGLEVAMRLLGRAQQDQGFGGKVFRQNMNTGEEGTTSMDHFFSALAPYLKGSGYRRMFRQAAGMPVRPRTRNYPGKPRGPQGPYTP